MEKDKSKQHQLSDAEMEACLQIFRDEPRHPDAGTTGAFAGRPVITEETRQDWQRVAKKFRI
jgi:hypothetical protein